ncbi:Response regulator receiver domain protein [Gemmata obscuriglobus]|uniref:Response regulator n=1 Tax=Gemmata obscuriglobus TaxID=114 RepID=A0A2Z3GY11_9BACT|nr:response regulator [Gemmata obscuriglobus]AWM38643.1 response regulator [Gemmata obscuriglobus]QEG28398.1 Response regulator receiver domain protein [Gemmata obscuriglobus]VTS06333.1 pas sensor protein : Response regulator receiver protein OS=Dethiosulfovibrio peptidovorans DSM 11002 GN=Dpep_0415 PE=4 SV=1: Response_reg [Gemmata obscuriglobus UQM 2246]
MTTLYDAGRPQERRPGVLLIDPDPTARASLARGLEGAGWHVWAVDGSTAMETYRLHRDNIDVALVDLQFPGLQGGRLLAELGQVAPELTRCAMSGGVKAYTASAYRRMSGTPLFAKPLDPRALAAALHDLLLVSRT